jgi:hypothetical protein
MACEIKLLHFFTLLYIVIFCGSDFLEVVHISAAVLKEL